MKSKIRCKKIITMLLAIITVFSTLPISVFASSNMGLVEKSPSDINVSKSMQYGHEVHYTTVDGKRYPLFCINQGQKSPSKSTLSKASYEQKVINAARWVYAGYYLEHGDNIDWLDMAYCQKKVWSVLGQDSSGFTFSDDGYNQWCKNAEKTMKDLDTEPSFSGKSAGTLLAGTHKVIKDTNGVFKDYPAFVEKTNGITITHNKNSNDLIIDVAQSCKNLSFDIPSRKYYKETTDNENNLLVYNPSEGGTQKLIYSTYYDPVSFSYGVSSKPKQFKITSNKVDIEKTHAQGDATLGGAVYGLYCNGELKQTYTTASDGTFSTGNFECDEEDEWYLQEISPSEGYLLDYTKYPVSSDPKGYSSEFNTTSNTVREQVIKGNIAIIKHTDDGSTKIETPEKGAEFQIYLRSSGSYYNADPDEKDTIVCDTDGFASTKLLPYGVYTVHQTKGWEGRELMKDFDVFISQDGQTYKFLINNANFESYLKIVKVDKETGKKIPYEGAAFEIYDENDHRISMQYTYPQVTTIHTFYTNKEGYLITPEKLKYGNYKIVEVQAPYGYVLDQTPTPFSITQENSSTDTGVTVVMVKAQDMAQKGVIEVTKTGEIFSSVKEEKDNSQTTQYTPIYEKGNLKDAVYEIYAAEDIITPDGTLRASEGEKVDTITTNDEGIAKSQKLYLGKYTVVEKTAPHKYVLDKEKYNVELTYAGQEVKVTSTSLTTYNERQKVSVSLSKIMEYDSVYSIGNHGEARFVKFGIYADEDVKAADGKIIPKDGLVTYSYCDSNGNITFNCDLPIDFKWYAKEVSSDIHYMYYDEHFKFDTKYAGQDIEIKKVNVNDGKGIWNVLKRGKIQGIKLNVNNQPLKDAVIGIFQPYECEFTDKTAIVTTKSDETGYFTFENVPFGEYIVKEITAPKDYAVDLTLYYLFISENGVVIDMTIVDKQVVVSKIDITTGKELEGAKLRVTDVNNNVIDEWTSTTEPHIVQGLVEGQEYILTEITAPYGYEVTEDVTFVVSGDKQTQKVEMKDDYIYSTVRVVKCDKTTKKVIKSNKFEFSIYSDKECKELLSTSGANKNKGTALFEDLKYGTYYIKETKAPLGYSLSDQVVEIVINDKGVFADGKNLEEENGIYSFEYYDELLPAVRTGDDTNFKAIGILSAIFAVLATAYIFIKKKIKKDKDTNAAQQ